MEDIVYDVAVIKNGNSIRYDNVKAIDNDGIIFPESRTIKFKFLNEIITIYYAESDTVIISQTQEKES